MTAVPSLGDCRVGGFAGPDSFGAGSFIGTAAVRRRRVLWRPVYLDGDWQVGGPVDPSANAEGLYGQLAALDRPG